ncbi:MAG: hypothetical protein K9M75_06775 [Phycisphaerae bacterium]|nr:hypothetical protein [Phycisphaerae bacterium]
MDNMLRRRSKGFMALVVLVSVVIVLILYMMMMKAILPAGRSGGGSSVRQDRPWLLDDLILPAGELIDMPEPPRLVIKDDFTLKPTVSRDGSNRGVAVLKFGGNGVVSGKWECDYTHEERQYSYIATYAGNIVIDKEFSDKMGTDKSLLFFIVKGKYTQRVYHPDIGEKLTNGIIYLSGWVAPDKSLTGKLTITTNDITDKDKWAASYDLLSAGQ